MVGGATAPAARSFAALALPGLGRVLRHDYPVTPGIVRALRESRPDVVVVSGWSTFASQAAIAWCRRARRARISRSSRATISARARAGGAPSRVQSCRVCFAVQRVRSHSVLRHATRSSNEARSGSASASSRTRSTFPSGSGRQSELAQRRPELRAELGAAADDVLVLSVARLGPEKGLDVLVRGVAAAGDPELLLVIAGEGPQRREIEALAQELGVRLRLTGDLAADEVAEAYAAADVFALLSTPGDVGCGRERGRGLRAAARSLGPRRCGVRPAPSTARTAFSSPAGDVNATGEALKRLAADAALRVRAGERSRELVRGWGYEPSVESFVAAVREATAR